MSRPNQFQHSLRLSPKSNPSVGRKRRSLRLSASTAEHTPKTVTSINGKSAITIQDLTANAQQKNIPSTKEAPIAGKSNLPHHFLPPPPNLYPLRHGMMSPSGSHQRFMHPMHAGASQHHQQQQPRPPQHHMRPLHPPTAPSQPQSSAASSHSQQSPIGTQPMQPELPPQNQDPSYTAEHQARMFGVNPPPITILVPYPVIIPIPIPIPIPMPIIEFMRAAQYKMDLEKHFQNNNNVPSKSDPTDEPLDFTKTRDPVATDESQPPDQCESPPLSQLEDMITEEHHTITMSSATDEDISEKDREKNPPDCADLPTKQPPQQQRLPKFKITRLNSRRIITSSSSDVAEAENSKANTAIGKVLNVPSSVSTPSTTIEISAETSRPLRKRKRLVHCDYSRLKDDDKRK